MKKVSEIKKCLLALVMLFTMSMTANADSKENNSELKVENVEMYKFNIHHKGLKRALGCGEEQVEFVDYVMDEFENDMLFAATIAESDRREMVVKNTVEKNIRLMSMVLDEEQYRKYLRLINITMANRGFEIK